MFRLAARPPRSPQRRVEVATSVVKQASFSRMCVFVALTTVPRWLSSGSN
jgi:hypothetical protein